MKFRTRYMILLSLLSVGCKRSDDGRSDLQAWQETRTSTDFLDFAKFIQVYPESPFFDSALQSYVETRQIYWDSVGGPAGCCLANCADIRFENKAGLLFEHEKTHIDSLRQQAFKFIVNKYYDPTKPALKEISIPETDSLGLISKGHFDFLFVPDSQLNLQLQKAVIQVSGAIDDYKDYLSSQWYGSSYNELSKSKRSALDSILATRLIFYEFSGEPIPPPPPTETSEVTSKKEEK